MTTTKAAADSYYDWNPWAQFSPKCCGEPTYFWHNDDPRWYCPRCHKLKERT